MTKYIFSLFGKLLFYLGIPFSLMCIYVIYTNSNIKSKKIKIVFADKISAFSLQRNPTRQLGVFNELNEKKYINKDFPIKTILNDDEPIDSLKYILANNRIIKIGSTLDVWVPPIGDYYVKYDDDSYLNGWLKVNFQWLLSLIFLNLIMIFRIIRFLINKIQIK